MTGIPDDIRANIEEKLQNIEAKHDVKIIYACESGSRAWGFPSSDSDYDVRFIYVHKLPWYVSVYPGRDVIELPIQNDLDINGWDLRKTLGLLRKSNPVLLEWLHSPIIYRQRPLWAKELCQLAKNNFSPKAGYRHYISMAIKTTKDHLCDDVVQHKKYFYALRPLLAARWIYNNGGVPPMNFHDLIEGTINDLSLKNEIYALLERKIQSGEMEAGPRLKVIHSFIETEILNAINHFEFASIVTPPIHILDDFLLKATKVHQYDNELMREGQDEDAPRSTLTHLLQRQRG